MKIKEILEAKGELVYSIGPDDTLRDAVALLVKHRIGALLVREATGAVAGIISERDILRTLSTPSADLGRLAVRDAMTSKVIVCVPDDDLDYAMGVMTTNRVRHLPVAGDGHVVGMISIGDLVKASLEEAQYENRYLKEYITGRR